VTSTVTLRPSRCTFKVILPSRGFRTSQLRQSLLNRTFRRPGPGRGAHLAARCGLAAACSVGVGSDHGVVTVVGRVRRRTES
jgi:hypothetical protein